jgi:hypothetical protein
MTDEQYSDFRLVLAPIPLLAAPFIAPNHPYRRMVRTIYSQAPFHTLSMPG